VASRANAQHRIHFGALRHLVQRFVDAGHEVAGRRPLSRRVSDLDAEHARYAAIAADIQCHLEVAEVRRQRLRRPIGQRVVRLP
jgi:hypothetical protein